MPLSLLKMISSVISTPTGKASVQIKLLQLDKSGIKVAEYMTELPKRELLEQKLHKVVELARKLLEVIDAFARPQPDLTLQNALLESILQEHMKRITGAI